MNKLVKLRRMDSTRIYPFLLLFCFLIVYILPLDARDLFTPDETRYGEISREMIADGHWSVPHLNGVRYFEKPPLGYWVNASSFLLFGENNFALRLPSALAAGLSGWLLFMLVYRMGGTDTRENAFLSVIIFLSCFGVFGVANIAVLDSLFSFFLTGAVAAFYCATEKPRGSAGEKGYLLLSGLSCGLALLTKGFLAFAVPVLVLVPYLIWHRRYSDLLRMSWLPIVIAVLVALPWGILIHLQEPDFWRYFFWHEHIQRFMGENSQHQQPFWFFILAAPGLFLPWSFLVPAAVAGLRKPGEPGARDRLLCFALCWFVFPFVFFSASSGKMITYILPVFPPFAILMALGLSQMWNTKNRKWLQWGLAATGLLFVIVFFALIGIQTFDFDGFRLYSQPWRTALFAIGLLVMALFCFGSLSKQNGNGKIVLLGLSPIPLLILFNFIIPDFVLEQSAPGPLLEKHKNQVNSDTVIIACERVAAATAWVYKRDDIYLLNWPGEMAYGLNYPDAAGRLLDEKSASRLIDLNRGNAILICRSKRLIPLAQFLPEPVHKEASGSKGYELWEF